MRKFFSESKIPNLSGYMSFIFLKYALCEHVPWFMVPSERAMLISKSCSLQNIQARLRMVVGE